MILLIQMTALYVMYFNKGQNTIYINTVLNNNNVLLLIDYVNVLLVQAILAICFSNVFYLISWNKLNFSIQEKYFKTLIIDSDAIIFFKNLTAYFFSKICFFCENAFSKDCCKDSSCTVTIVEKLETTGFRDNVHINLTSKFLSLARKKCCVRNDKAVPFLLSQ